MNLTLSPAARRGAALLILGCLLLAAAGLVWLPFRLVAGQEEEMVRLDQRIQGLEARLGTREQLLAERRALQRSTDLDRTLLPAETPALAGAELQRIVTGLVAQGGGGLESVQALDPEEQAPFLKIGLRASFTVSPAGLRAFLHGVEENHPVLLVDSLNLSDTGGYGGDTETAGVQLRAVVQLFGFSRAPAAEPPSGETRPQG